MLTKFRGFSTPSHKKLADMLQPGTLKAGNDSPGKKYFESVPNGSRLKEERRGEERNFGI